ncbi:MAG TPA: DUF2089 family protein [Chloroflexota bacterium]|nr:DUF2089 family protein [Chloroflexota bacterium]
MGYERAGRVPGACPACAGPLLITRLQCPGCGTEVSGAFASDRVVNLPEPHASLLELFLRVRGNVKEMERELGLSYPTVRARLEAALGAARARLESRRGPGVPPAPGGAAGAAVQARTAILDALEQGQISAAEAARRLREQQQGSTT